MQVIRLEKNSIFTKLFLSLLLVVSPIILIGVVMFLWEKQTIKSEIESNAFSNVSFVRQYLESEAGDLKELQYDVAGDRMLTGLIAASKTPSYDYYTMVSDVQHRLLVMENSNVLIKDVIVYFPGLGHMVSVGGGYAAIGLKQYEGVKDIYLKSKYPLIFDGGDIYCLEAYPPKAVPTGQPLFLIQAKLTAAGIRDLLAKYDASDNGQISVYDNTSGAWEISSRDIGDLSGIKPGADLSGKITSATVTIGKEKYYVVSGYSKYLNLSVSEFVPLQDIFRLPNTYGYLLWIYAGFSIVVLAVYTYMTYKSVKQPLNRIVKAFQRLKGGDLSVNIQFKAANEFNYLYDEFNNMIGWLNRLIDNGYKQQLYAQKAELKQLQSQINPHFLYNSYFMLDRMICVGDIENARALSGHLGRYFRFITRNTAEEVPLSQEAEHANSYAQIQQMRFSKQMNVEFGDIPARFGDFMVPRMILQPIVENAIEHGLRDTDQNGLLRVSFSDTGNGFAVAIEDNGGNLADGDIDALRGKLLASDGNAEITAILNVHRRIALRYGTGSGISVSRSELGGLKVEISIVPDSAEKA